MTYTAGQVPKVANVPNGGVALVAGSSNTVTLGSNTNGAAVYTAGSLGGRVMSLSAATDDTADVDIHVYIFRGSTVIPLGCVKVPLSSGALGTTVNVDFMDGAAIRGLPIDSAGKRYIPLMGSDVLKVGARVNLTSGKTCWVQAQGADYQA